MKLTTQQLTSHLSKSLAPIYLINGDEILLREEALTQIRTAAKQQGFDETIKLQADPKFDWSHLAITAQTRSLLSQKRIIELAIPTGKPGNSGGKALQKYAASPMADVLLLIITPKLDTRTTQTAWYKALDKAGASLAIAPINTAQLPNWIKQRLQQHELTADPQAIQFITDCVEGNFLAAKQEIEKLGILHGKGHLSLEDVQAALSDHTHFNIYNLADNTLQGNTSKVRKIIAALRSEGAEPILALWALTKELRLLAHINFALKQGQHLDTVLQQHRVWSNRQSLMQQAAKRLPYPQLLRMIQHAAKIDRVIKGIEPGKVWDELERLSINIAGHAI